MSNEKKSRIPNAGKGLFLRYGYKRLNMNDIAEAAGISRPALYLGFKNKGLFGGRRNDHRMRRSGVLVDNCEGYVLPVTGMFVCLGVIIVGRLCGFRTILEDHLPRAAEINPEGISDG